MLTYSIGKTKHWYFLEAIGDGLFRESQHFTSENDALECPKHQLVWQKHDGINTCSGCKTD